jgi:tetratricopeptide (TPR) repeat protein
MTPTSPPSARFPSTVHPLIAQAASQFQHGRHTEAEAVLRPLVAANPRDHVALHLLGVIARERGDHAQAIGLLKKAIGIEGRIAAYHGNLGHAHLMCEQFVAAKDSYLRVLAIEPGSRLARFGLGMSLFGQRDFAAAATDLEAVVKAEPNHVDGHLNLGAALSELGRHDEAAPHFERALALKPSHAAIHFKYGLALKSKGDLPGASRHLARAADLDPALADAPYQLGIVLLALDRVDEAAQALREALKRRPDMVSALYELGQVLSRLQSLEEASRCFERGLVLDPQSPALYLGLARTRHLQGLCQEARTLVAQALAHNADEAECQTMLGLIHQSEGHFDEAIGAYERAIAANPAHAHAYLCLTMLRKSRDSTSQIPELERLLSLNSPDAEQRATLEHALAGEYDNLGDHNAAFSHYSVANDLRKAQYPFDDGESASFTQRLIDAFNQDLFTSKAKTGSPSPAPVFIVGMLRSGTTLTEQILASHPDVHGHGELDYIRQIVHALPGRLVSPDPYPECVAGLDPATALHIAEETLTRLERGAPDALRHIDKLPHNFERLGMISLLFPRARIIHCTRDPVDTCLSCYFHDFASDNRYTNDLRTLGRFYRAYQRLMAHWEAVLPNPILRVPYEALVGDQEGWTRKLVDFIGLPWDERCLAFHQNERPVYTYSLWQVRQPIYTNAIERWRRYEKHLGPLFEALAEPSPAS